MSLLMETLLKYSTAPLLTSPQSQTMNISLKRSLYVFPANKLMKQSILHQYNFKSQANEGENITRYMHKHASVLQMEARCNSAENKHIINNRHMLSIISYI